MFGVRSDSFQGIGSPRMGMPLTIAWADPFSGGKMITSILLTQVRRVAHHLIRNVRIGNLQTIKLDAIPAFVLGVGPGVKNRNARHRRARVSSLPGACQLPAPSVPDSVTAASKRWRKSAGLPSDLMMNEPALNCWSPTLKGSSAALIFTSFSLKRSVARVLSVL